MSEGGFAQPSSDNIPSFQIIDASTMQVGDMLHEHDIDAAVSHDWRSLQAHTSSRSLQSEKTTADLRLSFYRQQAKTFPHGHRCCSTTIPLTRYWSLQFSPGTLESPVLGSPAGPLGDGRGGEGENYKFQHTGTYDPCTDMSDLIAPPGAFPHYVFWLGPFFSIWFAQ